MNTETQPATTEADVSAKPETEDTGAPETDYEKAAAEYDAAKANADPKKTEQPKAEPDAALAARVEALEAEKRQSNAQQALNAVVGQIKDAAPGLPEEFIEAWLLKKLITNRKMDDIVSNRGDAPSAYASLVRGLRGELAKVAKSAPDPDATADTEAVANAVRRNGNKTPEGKAPDYSRMSNQDFQKDIREKYGFTPQV